MLIGAGGLALKRVEGAADCQELSESSILDCGINRNQNKRELFVLTLNFILLINIRNNTLKKKLFIHQIRLFLNSNYIIIKNKNYRRSQL